MKIRKETSTLSCEFEIKSHLIFGQTTAEYLLELQYKGTISIDKKCEGHQTNNQQQGIVTLPTHK